MKSCLTYLCNLWLLFAGCSVCQAQDHPGHRLAIGPGTILLLPDSQAGLTLWARRDTRPGLKPSPDFVGWFKPASVTGWVQAAREFVAGSGEESQPLVALDSGFISLMRQEDACCVLAFGHPSERQRWVIEASGQEILALLDTVEKLARSSRWNPPLDLGNANPTDRAATPNREVGPLPAFRGDSGEVWARMTLDAHGEVLPGSGAILWASRTDMGDAVLRVISGYRYHRKDAKTSRLVVYQRFRVR